MIIKSIKNKALLTLCVVVTWMSLRVAATASDSNTSMPVDSSSSSSLSVSDNSSSRPPVDQTSEESGKELDGGEEGEYGDASSHLRLYYKSNSPFKYVSHEIEQKYDDQAEYAAGLERNGLYGPSIGGSRYYPDSSEGRYDSTSQAEKKRRTMLNLHYHGNSIDGLDTILAEQRMQQEQPHAHQSRQPYEHVRAPMPAFNTIQNEQRRKLIRLLASRNNGLADNNRARGLDNSENGLYRGSYGLPDPRMSVDTDSPIYGSYLRPVNRNNNDEDNLHYNIVHLKLRPDPRSGKLIGQGMVETDGYAEPRKVSGLPKEIPDLIQNLLRTTNVRSSDISKRSQPGQLAESIIPVDESIVSKRSSEIKIITAKNKTQGRDETEMPRLEENRKSEVETHEKRSTLENPKKAAKKRDNEAVEPLKRQHLDERSDDLTRETRSDDTLTSEDD